MTSLSLSTISFDISEMWPNFDVNFIDENFEIAERKISLENDSGLSHPFMSKAI